VGSRENSADARQYYGLGALGHDLVRVNARARVVIGQDTRAPAEGLPTDFCKGLRRWGWKHQRGVITTPGSHSLARAHGFDAGVVISASHIRGLITGSRFSGDGL